jgi:hypothetical protein
MKRKDQRLLLRMGACVRFSLVVCACFALPRAMAQQPAFTEQVLEGVVHGAQNQSYVRAPFRVPAGTERVTITFDYTAKEQHTALDLGLLDPAGLRCWSGGNKSMLTVGLSDATPSCLPGAIPAGEWKVLIGVPNIRKGVESRYTIHVYLSKTGAIAEQPPVLRAPLREGPGWYRGDLHMHTAHSDGQCPSQTGTMVPCPLFFTVDAAARRGLDFIAITDHNATSQYDAMRELQPYFDKVLLIPGREITTFEGHINFLGTTDFVDFRLGTSAVPDVNTLLRNADALGALTSINHPDAPSGEICMGCGWTPKKPVDMRLLTAVEAVNGGSEQYGLSGIPFWNKELNDGCRLTGVGGSDNHRAMQALEGIGSIGSPTTVVYATELSTPAILDGIRKGHVFIDLAGTRDRMMDVTASVPGATHDEAAHAGDELKVAQGESVHFALHVTAAQGGTVRWIEDGKEMPAAGNTAITSAEQEFALDWTSDGGRHWVRAEVTDGKGKLWLVGNPVYINWQIANRCGSN